MLSVVFLIAIVGIMIAIKGMKKDKPSGIIIDEDGGYSTEYKLLPNWVS